MRCLYCGKQLALFRRLTGSGEFCSDAHKQSYHEEYNRLALTRLIAAQTKSEEVKALLPNASTLEIARGDRGATRALPEARQPKLHQRWGDLSSTAPKSRMLEAPPAEPPPPPAPSFIITKMPATQLEVDAPVGITIEHLILASYLSKPIWEPALAEATAAPPPVAESVPLQLLPPPVASPVPSGIPNAPVPAHFPGELVTSIGILARQIAGLMARPAAPIDPGQFAAAPSSVLGSDTNFEEFRFAVLIFGSPTLDILRRESLLGDSRKVQQPGATPPGTKPFRVEPSRNRRSDRPLGQPSRSVLNTKPNTSAVAVALTGEQAGQEPLRVADTPHPLQMVSAMPRESATAAPAPGLALGVPSGETRRPSSIKVRLAALAATTPNVSPAIQPEMKQPEPTQSPKPVVNAGSLATSEATQPPAEPEKPRPRLPTIPASRRRNTSAMPSILEPEPEQDPDSERNRSLWGAIRKYIKK